MGINKYLPFAFIYFFINSLALPFGLTYTAVLSPLFYWWIVTTRKKEILLPFLVCLCPFFILHFILIVNTKAYIISVGNYIAVYIFCQAFYTFLINCSEPEKIFRKLLVVNFMLCIIAIPVYFTPYHDLLWMPHTLINFVENASRLKLLTYEASYYATLFTPLFFFYFLQLILRQNKMNSWLLMPMLILPLLLSFSVGVIGSVSCAVILTYGLYCRTLSRKKRVLNLILFFGGSIAFVAIALYVFYPQNMLFLRIKDVLSGNDTSGKGRTSEAFILAMQIMEQKSSIWGVGPGQIKILGGDIIRSYYLYPLDYDNIAIPNAAAETLAIFGWAGFTIRIFTELFLFFYTRVWTNYYRLLLFIFIFLYQFTGSFITNIAEYVIWIMAFTKAFSCFDIRTTKPAFYQTRQNAMQ